MWVEPSATNAPKVIAALRDFGAPLMGLTAADLERPGVGLQIGLPPLRVDILTQVSGPTFVDAWDLADAASRQFAQVVAQQLACTQDTDCVWTELPPEAWCVAHCGLVTNDAGVDSVQSAASKLCQTFRAQSCTDAGGGGGMVELSLELGDAAAAHDRLLELARGHGFPDARIEYEAVEPS